MSDQAQDARPAGVRYPFVNLEKAMVRAKQIFDADPKGREMTIGAAFATWSYSEKSSGGFQTIGALKMYGLLKDSSAGDSRKLALTSEALRYFRDEREEEKQKLLRDFALRPKLIATLWGEWHATPPSDAVARSHLKADRHLTEQAARTLLAIYKENLEFSSLKNGEISLAHEDIGEPDAQGTQGATVRSIPPRISNPKLGDYIQWTSSGMDMFVVPARVVWVAEDRTHLRVEGSNTGIPVHEVQVTPPPTVGAVSPPASAENQIQVLLDGKRLRITASVDRKGLRRLKKIIDANEQLLDEEDGDSIE